MFSQTWPALPGTAAANFSSTVSLWKWFLITWGPRQRTRCPTVAISEAGHAGSQGRYLPMGRAVTGVHLNCPCNLATHKAVIASGVKCDPHSSHLHHLSSCKVTAIYVLTTPTTIPGQQTHGRQSRCQYWNFTGQEDILIWFETSIFLFYLLFSQSCRNPAAQCKHFVQYILIKQILIMPANSRHNYCITNLEINSKAVSTLSHMRKGFVIYFPKEGYK